ncbi:hypothetical protein [Clostridium estertheticum]|uniref:hypothetical protein n=1 Tax=Clostridium estertheticum TaxID=238834 RepID=UPI001CF3EBCF|nr:hypothetical protein [Clostridium estertheticum]MCB2354470.1 hypothetical protein [Clostridium estertheticum]WAG42417.1 hypothetical protein LL065_06995 [Clostridium estertheticum]
MDIRTFIQIPNIAVWDAKKQGNTFIKIYGDKIIHILSYLDVHTDRLGIVKFTLEDMVSSCGLASRSGKGNSNNQFAYILDDLLSKDIITIISGDYKKSKNLVSCILKMPVGKSEWFPMFHDDYKKIIDDNLDRLILLNVYSYVAARLRRPTKDKEGKAVEDIVECMYVDYITFSDDLDITEATLNKYLVQLRKLGIIYYDSIGLIKKHDYSHEANNVYCLDKDMLPRALGNSSLYYKEEGFTILGKKTSKEMIAINGLASRIAQLKKDGKDTSKLEKKLATIEKNKKAKKKVIPENNIHEEVTPLPKMKYENKPDIFGMFV